MTMIATAKAMGKYFRLLLPRITYVLTILLILIGVCLLIFIWWFGPEWQWDGSYPLASVSSRWMATAVIVMIAVIALFIRMIFRLRKPAQPPAPVIADPHQPILDQQENYFNHWLARLKQYRNHKDALYQQPVYIVIGAQGSGKTSLIHRANDMITLPTLLDKEGQQLADIGPDRVRLLLTEQAVIIDPDGALLTHANSSNSDDTADDSQLATQKLWQNLLNWLLDHRRRQPLNGVILTLDLNQLISMPDSKRTALATLLQKRLQELEATLDSSLPVYVTLTKCDQLEGFDVLFASLTRQERESILGTSFTLNLQKPNLWQQELDRFWDNWLNQLNRLIMQRLLTTEHEQRSELFTITRQLAGSKAFVKGFLKDLMRTLAERHFILRGVYFTSVYQVGVPNDEFLHKVTERYGTELMPPHAWPNRASTTYFVQALFKQLIFSEPNLAGENGSYLRHRRNRLRLVSFVGIAVSALLIVGWQYYYLQNYRAGEQVLDKVNEFRAETVLLQQNELASVKRLSNNEKLSGQILPQLNIIRDATLAYGNYRNKFGLMSDLGLYQGKRVGPYVEGTYLHMLQQRYLPALMQRLQIDLNQAPINSERKLSVLRVMRMLDDKSGRRDKIVENYMRNVWQKDFTGQRPVQEQLMAHLIYALQHTDWAQARNAGNLALIDTYQPFDMPIKVAQKELNRIPVYLRVYQTIQLKVRDRMPPELNLGEQVSAQFPQIFTAQDNSSLIIPQFFTRYGLSRGYLTEVDNMIDLTSMDSWVLGLTKNIDYSEADRADIQRKITEKYIADYISVWQSAINNIDVVHFDNIPHATATIQLLIGNEQPMRRTLQTLSDHTRPIVPIVVPPTNEEKSTADKIKGAVQARQDSRQLELPENQLLTRISRAFIVQQNILNEDEHQTDVLLQVNQKLSDLYNYLRLIQDAPDPGKAALKAVQMRLKQNNSDPIFAVQQMAKGLPTPLDRWVQQIADQSWQVVVKQALQSLEVEWGEQVVKPFRANLAGRYPFAANSKQDAPLSQVNRFFAPDGILDSFYKENLELFMDNNLNYGDGTQLLRYDVLRQLALAKRIRDTFFTAQNGMGVQFAIEPVELSANKRRSVLNLDGQLLDYSQGRQNVVRLVWPNTMREGAESKITLVPDSVNRSPRWIAYTGQWAMFRLINAGALTYVNNGDFNVRYDIDGGYMIYRVSTDAVENPFAGGLFSEFNLPDTLY